MVRQDRVNVEDSTRQLVPVRPFMPSILEHAEARLVMKQTENAPVSEDGFDAYGLVSWARRKLDDHLAAHFDTPRGMVDLADALNLIAMAYDTIEQDSEAGAE